MADDKKLTPEDVEGKLDASSTNPAVITEFADMDLSEFNEEDLIEEENVVVVKSSSRIPRQKSVM